MASAVSFTIKNKHKKKVKLTNKSLIHLQLEQSEQAASSRISFQTFHDSVLYNCTWLCRKGWDRQAPEQIIFLQVSPHPPGKEAAKCVSLSCKYLPKNGQGQAVWTPIYFVLGMSASQGKAEPGTLLEQLGHSNVTRIKGLVRVWIFQ